MSRPPRKKSGPGQAGRRPPRQRRQPAADPRGERLQKVLATAGLGSRRECEELIRQGRVDIDGQTVSELGVRVEAATQEIRVDGVRVNRPQKLQYFAVNKPVGVVTTNRDPAGRTRVVDLVRTNERLFPVGRLDRSSEGLILLTNDGEFANRIAHPRYGVQKTYRVLVAGDPAPEKLQQLIKGVHLAEGLARVESVRVRSRRRQSTELEITLAEGRNREIRRLLARIGHKVLRLKRVAIGSLRLGDLPAGTCRLLTRTEVKSLLEDADQQRARKPRPPKPSGPAPTQRGRVEDEGDAAEESADSDWVAIPYEPGGYGAVLGDEEINEPAPQRSQNRPRPASGRTPRTGGKRPAKGHKRAQRAGKGQGTSGSAERRGTGKPGGGKPGGGKPGGGKPGGGKPGGGKPGRKSFGGKPKTQAKGGRRFGKSSGGGKRGSQG